MSVTPILPICVKPYPNELLYGWLIRLAKINMYPSAESFCERYFPQDGPKYEINEHKMIRPDYRFNLDNVCKWYENIRCFPDAMTILHDMTPYFTIAPFLTRGYQVMRSQAILREQTGGILDISRLRYDVNEFHVCPECYKKDTDVYGEAYLHTEHHLPGVTVCPRHHVPLLKVSSEDAVEGISPEACDEVAADEPMTVRVKNADMMSAMYRDPLLIDLKKLQAAVLVMIREKGYPIHSPYGCLKENVIKAGYWPHDTSDAAVKSSVVKKNADPDLLRGLILYLFEDYEDLKAVVGSVTDGESEGKVSYDSMDVLEERYGFIKVRCRTCGAVFHIHPYAFELGRLCPECEKRCSDEENIARMLRCLGDGTYRLAGPAGKHRVRLLHETCGREREIGLMDAVYGEKECVCSLRTASEGIEEVLGDEFILLDEYVKGSRTWVTILHTVCGKIFSLPTQDFKKSPHCRVCDEEHVPEAAFRKKMRKVAGDEYELVSDYDGSGSTIELRHKACGTVTKMKAANFLHGCRCRLCYPRGSGDPFDLQKVIDEYAGEGYTVTQVGNDKILVTDKNGEIFTGSYRYFLQELSRPTSSSVFKYRKKILQPGISKRGAVYMEIKEHCEKYRVWIADGEAADDAHDEKIDILKYLVYDGYLHRYGLGIYSIYDDVSDEEILSQKYLIRAGHRIGVYYGKSLLYRCGIIGDKPDKDYIISNACLKKEFDDKKTGDITVRVKRPYVEITDENYRIIEGLNLAAFLIRSSSYKDKVEKYLLKEGIDKSMLLRYAAGYPDKVTWVIKTLYTSKKIR